MNQLSKQIPETPNSSGNSSEITKALYLVGTSRGLYAGHAALILVNSKGNGTIYSSQFDMDKLGDCVNGKWIDFELYRKELSSRDINSYFKTGKIPFDSANKAANAYLSDYNKYIVIPVKSPYVGKIMHEKAETMAKTPGKFNLYERNCNHLCQEILSCGNLNFTPVRGSADIVLAQIKNTHQYLKQWKLLKALYYAREEYKKDLDFGLIPNVAYDKGVELAKKNNYEYGSIGNKRRILGPNTMLDTNKNNIQNILKAKNSIQPKRVLLER